MEILKHVPVSLGRVPYETTTPTGAAIIKATVNEFVKTPHFHIQRIGYGIGHKDFSIPNVLRVFLVEEASEATQEIVLETNIDDMSPEILAFVQEKLFSIGVKDVYTTAITTKKKDPLSIALIAVASFRFSTPGQSYSSRMGTPENVGPVVRGDVILCHIDGLPDLSVKIV